MHVIEMREKKTHPDFWSWSLGVMSTKYFFFEADLRLPRMSSIYVTEVGSYLYTFHPIHSSHLICVQYFYLTSSKEKCNDKQILIKKYIFCECSLVYFFVNDKYINEGLPRQGTCNIAHQNSFYVKHKLLFT